MVSAGHPASPWDGGAGAARQMPALISHCAFPHPAPASQKPFPLRLFWRHSAFQHLNFSFCTHFLPPLPPTAPFCSHPFAGSEEHQECFSDGEGHSDPGEGMQDRETSQRKSTDLACTVLRFASLPSASSAAGRTSTFLHDFTSSRPQPQLPTGTNLTFSL